MYKIYGCAAALVQDSFSGDFEARFAHNAYHSLCLRKSFVWISLTSQSEFGKRSYDRFTKTAQSSDIVGDPLGSHANATKRRR